MYFIIKSNKNENFVEIKSIIEPIEKNKVKFSDKIDYYEEIDILHNVKNKDISNNVKNNNISNNVKNNNISNNVKNNNISGAPSFYSKSWNGNYYLEHPNGELKKLDIDNTNMNINPKPEEDKEIDLNLLKTSNKIKDIYNSYADNYKDYEKKNLINSEEDNKILDGASNLSYFSQDTWIYENENIINGGLIDNDLTGYDEVSLSNNAIF